MGAHTEAKLVHLSYANIAAISQVSVITLFHDHPDHQGIRDWRQVLFRKLFDDRTVQILDVLVTAFSATPYVFDGKLE
jgi:hypothetical protein